MTTMKSLKHDALAYYNANVILSPIDPRESDDFTVSFPREGDRRNGELNSLIDSA